MTKLEFIPPLDSIQVQAEIAIAAPPEDVAAIYCDVERWGQIFPATIEVAHIIETGDNWQRVDVLHRIEGHIMNELIFLSQTEIALKENKRQFRAGFLNQFLSVARCETRYVITAYISLKGIYKMLRPVLEAYVRKQALKQINQYVLEPFKKAAEKVHSEPVRLKGSCQ